MSKPIILLIHGMGTHPPGNMRKEFIDGINDTAKLFEITDFDIEEKAQIEEFNYSEFLDSRRKADAEYAKSVAGLMTYLQGRGMGESILHYFIKCLLSLIFIFDHNIEHYSEASLSDSYRAIEQLSASINNKFLS